MIERPVFIVAPPCSGAELLVRSLRRAEGVWTPGKEGPGILDEVPALAPSSATGRATGSPPPTSARR